MNKSGKNNIVNVYGARINNLDILKKSTSGGVFTVISDLFLKGGGLVCGAVYSSNMEVNHIVSKNKKDRDLMRGAKYVQSNMGNVMNEVIEYLQLGIPVLFSGTPCQVLAIKKIAKMKKVEDKLFAIDIVCHGVPSPGLFKEHILNLEKKYGKITSYIFRDKRKGWRGQNVTVTTEKGIIPDKDAKLYSSLYFNSLIIRPSCHNCQFSSIERYGDITIGDFWGISEENSKYDDNLGISQVMINSKKGEEVFDHIKDSLDFFEVASNSYIQPNMKKPTKQNEVTNIFWNKYNKYGIVIGNSFLRQIKIRLLPYRINSKLKGLFNKNEKNR